MLTRRNILNLGAASAAACVFAPSTAPAQSYPDHPVKLVIPFPPGGVYDALGRPFADRLRPLLGTIVIENIGGAGGALAAASVARARPDGYTLLLGGSGALIVAPVASTAKAFDPVKDFEPIYHVASVGICIAVTPSLPVTNLSDLVAYGKANPGKLSYATSGVGSWNHLTGEMFKLQAGLPDMVHVPYRGAGPALTDLIAGQVPVAFINVTGSVLEFHRRASCAPLVTTPKRLSGAPETDRDGSRISGSCRRSCRPVCPERNAAPIIRRIAETTRAALAEEELQKLFVASGLRGQSQPALENMRQHLADEIAALTPIIKASGLVTN